MSSQYLCGGILFHIDEKEAEGLSVEQRQEKLIVMQKKLMGELSGWMFENRVNRIDVGWSCPMPDAES